MPRGVLSPLFPIAFPTSLPQIDRLVKGLIPSHLDGQFLISLPHSISTRRAEVHSCIQERRRGLLVLTPWLVAMAGVLTARPSPSIDISPCLPSVFLHLSAPLKGALCGKLHPVQTYIYKIAYLHFRSCKGVFLWDAAHHLHQWLVGALITSLVDFAHCRNLASP